MPSSHHVPCHLQITLNNSTQVPPFHCCEQCPTSRSPSYLSVHRCHYAPDPHIKPRKMCYRHIHTTLVFILLSLPLVLHKLLQHLHRQCVFEVDLFRPKVLKAATRFSPRYAVSLIAFIAQTHITPIPVLFALHSSAFSAPLQAQ